MKSSKKLITNWFYEAHTTANDGSIGVPNPPYAGLTYKNKLGILCNTGGFYAIQQELDTWINVGKTFSYPVISVGKSYSGSASSIVSVGSTQLTTIYTGEMSFATPGSNVTLSGFSGSWTGVNGYYANGVSVYENTSWTNPYTPTMDYTKLGPGQFTGSYVNVYNKFMLNKDTFSLVNYSAYTTGANAGKASDFNIGGAVPTVSITHRFTPLMTYNEFMAAMFAFILYVYGEHVHSTINIDYVTSGKLGLLPTAWNKLGNQAGNTLIDYPLRFRPQNGSTALQANQAQGYTYFSPVTATTPIANVFSNRNDPYAADEYLYKKFYAQPYLYTAYTGTIATTNTFLPAQRQPFNPLVLNYLTGAKFPVFGWGGSGTNGSIETDPVYSLTKNIYNMKNTDYPNTFGGSQVNYKLFDIEAVGTGAGGPTQLDVNYWYVPGPAYSAVASTGIGNINAYKLGNICGFIRPNVSTGALGGKNIGYIKLSSCLNTIDNQNIMTQPTYGPKTGVGSTGSQKYFRESISKYWATFMAYLLSNGTPDSIIFDLRTCRGSARMSRELSEFFGSDRAGWKTYMSRKGDGYADLIDCESAFTFSPQTSMWFNDMKKYYVENNRTMYPNSVFSGTGSTPATAKKVVVLAMDVNTSAGCSSLFHWYGNNWDRNIGSNTVAKLMGSAHLQWADDSTVYFGTSYMEPAISKFSKKINNATTTNFPYLRIQADSSGNCLSCAITGPAGAATQGLWTHAFNDYTTISASTYTGAWKGLNGGNALPEDAQSTVYPDWGIIAPSSWTPGSLVGYDGFVYIDDGRSQPDVNDWTTWRDRWLESSIREAYQPVM